VFSPYYAWARRRPEGASPLNHVAINAALYSPGRKRWSLTERGAGRLERDAATLRIGPSAFRREGDRLIADIDEITVPYPRRLKGRVIVRLEQRNEQQFELDAAGRHLWQPIAPRCHVEAEFEEPALSWRGRGYLDSNRGSEPLETGFRNWWWSRTHRPEGTYIGYETHSRRGEVRRLAVRFDEAAGQGFVTEALGTTVRLPKTSWRIERPVRTRDGSVRLVRTLEDTPFYSRSLIETSGASGTALGVHESLDLDRFASSVVQLMLPFRMPRRAR